MRKLIALTVLALTLGGVSGTSTAQAATQHDNANRSIWHAIEYAGPIFGVSTKRLHYRVSKEGGHGRWVPNRQGSGAGGWFQFMKGTYYGYSSRAFAYAARRGYPIPAKFNSWYSPLGQAITASYMFMIGLECSRAGWAASC